MAIRRRPPHPARALIFPVLLILALIGGAIWLASSAEEVPVRPIEVDIARPA